MCQPSHADPYRGIDSIQRLPVINYMRAVKDLHARYRSLLPMASELPSDVRAPSSSDAVKIIKQIEKVFETGSSRLNTAEPNDEKTFDVNSSAMHLALFGWEAEEEGHVPGLVACNACFRRLGLWLFCASPSVATTSGEERLMNALDVVAEHRDYCPWINSFSQNGVKRRSSLEGLTGWETLLKTVSSRSFSPDTENTREGEAREEPVSEAQSIRVSPALPEDWLDNAVKGMQDKDDEEEEKRRDAKDKERWAKLKRVSQVFRLKGSNRSSFVNTSKPASSGTTTTGS